ncbi:hypothetical protein [Flavobacterium litorale]|uniref:Uncharacterized protein n=1 Tax=Flavobacterium litorale TaxID=2856519 RepID=A0ABX8V842_9FLAO|nr:hypothetical protein [Flavobacterium litorale]QYJ68672.1 hypothetical protein K1I41_01985 [Flavobacterium litorale]
MKTAIFLFMVVALLGCKAEHSSEGNHDLIGVYKSKKPNKFNVAIGRVTGVSYGVGNKMILNKDSTFVYETCAMVISGKWSTENDTLLMYYDKKRFKVEELNTDPEYIKFIKVYPEPHKIQIKGARLIKKSSDINGDVHISELIKQEE